MAFPLSPVNGQTATINGISHVYNSTSGTWTRVVAVNSYTSANAPTNPNIGDIWYNPTTDVIARYTSDGAYSYWLDVTGPTVSGLTVQNTSVYANSFNGTSQYLSVPTNAAWTIGTSDYTVECWINTTDGVGDIVSAFSNTGVSPGWLFGVGLVTSGKLTVYLSDNVTNQTLTSTGTVNSGTWRHVAFSKSGTTLRFFIDGVLDSTQTITVTNSIGSSQPILIGRDNNLSPSRYFSSHISNLRIVKGTALYIAAFTVPAAPLSAITNTQLLTCQTIPAADASTNKFAVTDVGGVGLSILSAQQTSAAINTNSPIILPDASQFSTANSFGMRNRLINGAMSIDQRNAGAAQTITAAAALAYTVDRWYAYSTGANVSGQRVAGAGALQHVYQFTGVASTTAIGFAQRVEAINSYDLNGTTVNLSAFLSNSLLSTVTWTAYYANSADTFGTLASPTRTQIATGSWSVTSSLARYSTQIVIPTAATTGIEIVFTVGAQTSGTWRIGAVQFEPGTVATPFERRPVTTELQLCQRYLQVYKGSDTVNPASNAYTRIGYGPANNTTSGIAQVKPLVTLRVIPGITTNGSFALYDGVSIPTISAPTLDTASTPYSVLLAYGGATGLTATRAYELIINNSQTAYLWLTAEL